MEAGTLNLEGGREKQERITTYRRAVAVVACRGNFKLLYQLTLSVASFIERPASHKAGVISTANARFILA